MMNRFPGIYVTRESNGLPTTEKLHALFTTICYVILTDRFINDHRTITRNLYLALSVCVKGHYFLSRRVPCEVRIKKGRFNCNCNVY